jgi:hypothetical protein
MSTIHVFTSAACNYIPKVRALVGSIRRHHPEWRVHLALSDKVPDGVDLSREPFDEIHSVAELGIPDYLGWAFCHDIVELSTAIKPFVLAKLLERPGCGGVVYLDPDTLLFSPLTEVVTMLGQASIGLTPHLVLPEPDLAGVMDNEIAALKHGIYNLGFLAVAPTDSGRRFAGWWADRCYHFCRDAIPHGLFTDQRWIDLVPAFFEDVCILRSTRLNVASWNVSTRRVTGEVPEGMQVDSEPLGFYHFTGFDSGAHRTMAWKHASDQPAVKVLLDWYAATIAKLGRDPLCSVPWAYSTFADGSPIPTVARLIYRERVDLQRAFPDPFATASGGYRRWWESQSRIEYPALFQPGSVAAETQRIAANLTPGFNPHAAAQASLASCIRDRLERAVVDPAYRGELASRTLKVLRTEGVAGLYRRLVK